MQAQTLYIVLPCYNEEAVLPETAARLLEKLDSLIDSGKVSPYSRIVFVDDGSGDQTWGLIEALHEEDPIFQGIKLSRNEGHQNALLAGLMTVRSLCDMAVSMDADLQDDINAIDEMVDKYYAGNDVVYGVRSSRRKDSLFKKSTAQGYYKIMQGMGAELIYNHADYRLMSRRALAGLAEFPEVNLFLRGMVPMIGYPSDVVYYERGRRKAGESKYPLRKMLSFAWEGITSLSIRPIRFITQLGLLLFLFSIVILIYALVRHFMGATNPGWTSLAISIWAIGGLQILSIGIIGQYIGKVYLETKKRPRYFVQTYLDDRTELTDKPE